MDPHPSPAGALPVLPAAPAVLRRVRPAIQRLHGYTPGEQMAGCLKLNTNECPYEPGPGVLAALAALPAEALRLYPDPNATALRQAAAERYGVLPEAILVGNGSDDCLTILYRALLEPGGRIAFPWPTYGLYETLAGLQGCETVPVDYRRSATAWQLPTSLARQGAQVVVVANPNNPSATLAPVEDLRRLADALDGVLIVDEAYVDFAPPGASLLPHLAAHPNLVVLRTFSKSYSLAGARLGLLFAHPVLVEQFAKVKDSYNVNALTQRLGIAALADVAHHRQMIARILTERQRLGDALAAFGWTWPASTANFLLCQVGPRAGAICRALREHGILVRWWDRPELREYLRITVGRPEDTDRLVAQLRAVV